MERFQRVLVLFLLLAYAGQSLAMVGAPCLPMGPASGAMDTAATQGMDHSGHHMDSMGQDGAAGESCCEGGGFCSISHCQSVAALAETGLATGPALASVHREAPSFSSLIFSSGSLYRPPITS